MATNTTNYQLIKPAGSDKYNISIFNENWDAIDTQMKVNADGIGTKQDKITGAATTVTTSNLTASRVIISNTSGKFAVSPITSTELGYLDGAKSNIQTQINNEITARTDAVSALDSSVVKLTGNQTIGDLKTFTSRVRMNSGMDLPADDSVNRTSLVLRAYGSGAMSGFLLNNSTSSVILGINTNLDNPYIRLGYGGAETYAVTPTDKSDNSTRIATTAWVNTASTVVHTTGNETVGGQKTFTGMPIFNYNTTDTRYDTEVEASTPMMILRSYGNSGNIAMYRNPDGTSLRLNLLNANKVWRQIDFYNKDDGTSYVTVPETRSTGYASNEVVTAGWADAKISALNTSITSTYATQTALNAVDASAVHIADNETITGNKAFSEFLTRSFTGRDASLQIRNFVDDSTVQPASPQYTGFKSTDMNGLYLGGAYTYRNGTTNNFRVVAVNNIPEEAVNATLSVFAKADGTTGVTVPTPSDSSDNSTTVATTSWVNTAASVVHKTGNETVAGNKIFTSNVHLDSARPEIVFNTDIPAKESLPDSTYYGKFTFRDVDAVERANIAYNLAATGNANIRMVAQNYKGTSAEMKVQVDADDSKYATAPATRTTGYGSTDIVTAGWADAKYVALTGAQTITGEKTFEQIPVLSDWNQIVMGNSTVGWRKVATITTTSTGNNVFNALVEVNRTYNYIGGLLRLSARTNSEGLVTANAYWEHAHDINLDDYVIVYDISTNTADFWVRIHNNFSGCSIRCVDQFSRSVVSDKTQWRFLANSPIEENITSTGVQVISMKPTSYVITDSADNSDGIATTSWVNRADSVVHKTGNETIAGTKTFNSTILTKSTSYTLGENTDGWKYLTGHTAKDASNNTVFQIQNRFLAQRLETRFQMAQMLDDGTIAQTIPLTFRTEGDSVKAFCVEPVEGYISSEIATCGWVDAKVNALASTYATLEYVNDSFDDAENRYATKDEVDTKINAIPKETWTFVLEDGSTVTKEVLVG